MLPKYGAYRKTCLRVRFEHMAKDLMVLAQEGPKCRANDDIIEDQPNRVVKAGAEPKSTSVD